MKPDQLDADQFRGLVNELLLCEGARVLLTQNLWVEAGLMNGALGHLVGYMWPEGGDPHSSDPKLRSPLCVFVEFDDVDLGHDEKGAPRSFFPGHPTREKWVPIFRQEVFSSVVEHVSRENYPLQLAWALTHWKAQGMTLDRVRVHLTERTAAVPGLAFVACTRVRHPWDLVFEEDLPEYEHFMKARRTPAFRERRRFELRCEARSSRTLRRYGYCEADLWSPEERGLAQELLEGLKTTARMQRARLSSGGRRVDPDTWLWGEGEPDFEGELGREVQRLSAGQAAVRGRLAKVADRLLDRSRVRAATPEESAAAGELLQSLGSPGPDAADGPALLQLLLSQADALAGSSGERSAFLRGVARSVAGCFARRGSWAGEVEDSVPPRSSPCTCPRSGRPSGR